jgi:hypothetical protein
MNESPESPSIAEASPRRSHLNATTAERLVSAWEQSGVSAVEFCRDQAVTAKMLLRWRSRLRPDAGLSRVVVASPADMVSPQAQLLRVVGSHGLSIEVASSCDEAVLRRVCRALSC